METWLTADLHLGHANIIGMCGRPHISVEEMDADLIKSINDSVRDDDRLYILGDFALRQRRGVRKYREQINCKNVHLVLGNHDDDVPKGLFASAERMIELTDEGRLHVLCHYPMRSWRGSNRGSFHFHGHSHGRGTPAARSLDVGVDCRNFAPISLSDARIESLMGGVGGSISSNSSRDSGRSAAAGSLEPASWEAVVVNVDQGSWNDCLSACLASMLELPLSEVPVFAAAGAQWKTALDAWLAQFNLQSVLLVDDVRQHIAGPVVVCGKSPRGDFNHCVVYQNGRMVWDPHQTDKSGVLTHEYIIALVVRDPAKSKK